MKLHLWLGALLLASGIAAAAEAITDDSEKKNCGSGRETQIRTIGELAKAANVSVTPETPYLVLLSDFHLYDPANAGKQGDVVWSKDIRGDLEKLVATIDAFRPRPGMVVVTGNLAHDGGAAQYEELKRIFAKFDPAIPLFAIPGNQDDPAKMREILGDAVTGNPVRKLGDWTLVGLDTGKQGTLSRNEAALLKQALTEAGTRPVMIFTHHTPVQQPGWEPVRALRETLAKAAAARPAATWLVSGHAHANFLVRMHYDGLKEIPVLTNTSSTSSYGYDAPSLRVVFLGRENVAASAIWRYAAPDAGFRIDPPVSDWPAYTPAALDPDRELLNIDREKQKELAVERRGVGEAANYDYIDADGRLLLAIPAAEYATHAPLTLELDLESDYLVRAGSSEDSLATVFDSGSRQPRKTLRLPVPPDAVNGILYLEIRDRTPKDGFGAFIHGIRLLGRDAN